HYNVLSIKVKLAEDVNKGQIVSINGQLANTGEADKAPAGVAQYDGKTGEIIAITVIGLVDVAHTGLAVGDGVKATAGNVEKATSPGEAFAVVTEVTTTKSAEILIK
ncbi:MAG: hypothetical protein CR977_02825, partial [Gammaproteobacteria bacterium]